MVACLWTDSIGQFPRVLQRAAVSWGKVRSRTAGAPLSNSLPVRASRAREKIAGVQNVKNVGDSKEHQLVPSCCCFSCVSCDSWLASSHSAFALPLSGEATQANPQVRKHSDTFEFRTLLCPGRAHSVGSNGSLTGGRRDNREDQ